MSKIVKSIYKGRIVDLRIETHRLPKGEVHNYEIVRHVPAAAVLPIHGDQILLIKQYRVPLKKFIWEIPAGLLEKGESPLVCVRREIIEETGYRGKNYKKLCEVYTTAGFSDEKVIIYQCELGKHVGTAHEGSEDISIHLFTVERVKKMLKRGEIKDAKTLIALQNYFASCR